MRAYVEIAQMWRAKKIPHGQNKFVVFFIGQTCPSPQHHVEELSLLPLSHF